MKRSIPLLIAGILGAAYLLYLITYFTSATTTDAAGAIATAIVTPHIVLVGLAVAFNFIGWATRARWAALTAGILYTVSIIFMFIYAPFVLVQLILCFIAFGRMKKPGIQS